MKKIIFVLLIIFLALPFIVGAQIEIENPLKYGTIPEIIQAFANFIFWLAIPITSLMVVIGGVMFMTSSGKPEKVEQAKKLLLYSVIGLAIILLSRVIAAVIENILA